MDKGLPKVFVSPINKDINNNREYYYNEGKAIDKKDKKDIEKKINEIFASSNHVYKSKVKITKANEVMEALIVGKTRNDLLTLNGEKISISEILDIEKT